MSKTPSGISMEALLSSMLMGKDDNDDAASGARSLPEAQIMELQQMFQNYQKGCPFKPGDLVTPRKNSYLRNAGDPHIVLEVFETPRRLWNDDDPFSHTQGARIDVRVASVSTGKNMRGDESITAWCGESWCYEPYEGDV